MVDLHIDDFYKDTAKIFIHLYNSFPNKVVLYVEDITGNVEQDEFGLYSERYLSALSSMIWLGENNYLQYSSLIKQEALDQAVLTQKGFSLLSTRAHTVNIEPELAQQDDLPASIMRESHRNINLLREALKSGSSIIIEQQVSALLNH